MAEDSVKANGFYLKPGGMMQEALPTELEINQYTQSSGITKTGELIRMPGKRLVQQFQDRVLQVAGFGGAVIIQHGSTIIMYPDSCALAPTDDDDANTVIVPLPVSNLVDQSSTNTAPNPWTTHPNTPTPTGNYGLQGNPPLYHDIEVVDPTNTGKTVNLFYLYFYIAGIDYLAGDSSNPQVRYSATNLVNRSVATLDLTQYTRDQYSEAVLVGDSQQWSAADTPGPWTVGGYTQTVTDLLGKRQPGSIIPIPKQIADTPWQTYVGPSDTWRGNFLYSVRITGLKLYFNNSNSSANRTL